MSKLTAIIGIVVISAIIPVSFANTAAFGQLLGYSESTIVVKDVIADAEDDLYCSYDDVQARALHVKNVNGDIISHTTTGSQVSMEATIVDNCALHHYPFLLFFDFRIPDDGSTESFSYQNMTLNEGDRINVSASWIPEKAGHYDILVFSIHCLQCTGLSPVDMIGFDVFD